MTLKKIHFVFFHSLKLTGIIPNTDQISIVSKPVLGKQGSVLNLVIINMTPEGNIVLKKKKKEMKEERKKECPGISKIHVSMEIKTTT